MRSAAGVDPRDTKTLRSGARDPDSSQESDLCSLEVFEYYGPVPRYRTETKLRTLVPSPTPESRPKQRETTEAAHLRKGVTAQEMKGYTMSQRVCRSDGLALEVIEGSGWRGVEPETTYC